MNFVVYVLSGDILSLGNTHFTVHKLEFGCRCKFMFVNKNSKNL